MKKLFAAIRRVPKRTAGLVMVAAAVIGTPLALWAWGPERPTYTVENAAPQVTFNSITNHQRIGDERNFVRIREVADGEMFRNDVHLEAGKTYEVMVFYHNNAKQELNDKIGADGKPVGYAQNTTARVQMPGRISAGETGTVTGFISASNATPETVWDNATATTSNDVALRYVQGSAKIASSNGAVNGAALSNELFRDGVKLGYDKLDGTLPGCNQYSGYITYQFVVDQPDFTIEKQVSVDGGKTWTDNAKAAPGSTIQYRMVYQNTGTVQQNDVILQDQLPDGVSYIEGSSLIAHSKSNGKYIAAADGITSDGGYKIGSYAPNGNAYFKFSAKVASNSKLATCGENTLTNKVVAHTANGNKSDTATVTTTKECVPEKPTPSYTCDNLSVKKIERTKFEFSTNYTVKNATFKQVTYVVRDAKNTEVYRGTNSTYTQTTPGAYRVQAYVTVTVDGVEKTVTSNDCQKQFVVEKEATPGVSIDKKVDGVDHKTVAVNQEFTYQITVTNTGETTLKNVSVTDIAPEHVTFVRADKGDIKDNAWSYVISSLETGKSATLAITAVIKESVDGEIKNTACVDAPSVPGTPDDCDDATVEVPPVTPEVPEIKVCDLESSKVITIKESDLNTDVHSTDLDDCATTPTTPETPTELPTTGIGEGFSAMIGLGSLMVSAGYYIISRRNLGA